MSRSRKRREHTKIRYRRRRLNSINSLKNESNLSESDIEMLRGKDFSDKSPISIKRTSSKDSFNDSIILKGKVGEQFNHTIKEISDYLKEKKAICLKTNLSQFQLNQKIEFNLWMSKLRQELVLND